MTAVVFDLFHTLVDLDADRPAGFDRARELAAVAHVDEASFRAFWAETYDERETTPIDLVDLVDRFASTAGRPLDEAQRAAIDRILGVGCDAGMLRPDPAIVAMVQRLADHDLVGVLSNCHEREVRHWDDSPFATAVRTIARSSRIGVAKPEPAAYRWIIERLAIDPATAMYVGNGGSDELAGARRAGFGTVVHCNVFDLRYDLVDEAERRRRAADADASVDTIDDYVETVTRLAGV